MANTNHLTPLGGYSDAGTSAGSADQTVKENTEEPSTESAGGFSMPVGERQLSSFGMEDEPEVKPDPVVAEKTQLLRDDFGRGSGFVNGKLRIAEYYEQHQPTDYVNSLYPLRSTGCFLVCYNRNL